MKNFDELEKHLHTFTAHMHGREMIPLYCALFMIAQMFFHVEEGLVRVLEIAVLLKDFPTEL